MRIAVTGGPGFIVRYAVERISGSARVTGEFVAELRELLLKR
jgi:hypothetical protein